MSALTYNGRFSVSYFLCHLIIPREQEMLSSLAPLAVHAPDAVWEYGLFLEEMKEMIMNFI